MQMVWEAPCGGQCSASSIVLPSGLVPRLLGGAQGHTKQPSWEDLWLPLGWGLTGAAFWALPSYTLGRKSGQSTENRHFITGNAFWWLARPGHWLASLVSGEHEGRHFLIAPQPAAARSCWDI